VTRRRWLARAVGLLAVAVAVGPAATAGAEKPEAPGEQGMANRPVCGSAPAGFARCHARIVDKSSKKRTTTTSSTSSTTTSTSSTTSTNSTTTTAVTPPAPAGYSPADLQAAYVLPSLVAGAGQTVAVVAAYDGPTAEADLGVYRSYFGLPACTTANGCFRKVDQRGGTRYPVANAAWAQEISLDLDMVSAVCPNCRILLVEADSNSFANLGAAVSTAARLGATAISNSYGAPEALFSFPPDDSPYNQPGVAVTASSGDSGYGAEFPASSSHVTSVGGTSLFPDVSTTRRWSETAWAGAGSGCSTFFPKPAWQVDPGCARRTVADVAVVADPATGVAVYDSYPSQGRSGWLVFGGTSVGAPVVAAAHALAGTNVASRSSLPYDHPSAFFDVVSGGNGTCPPSSSYLCTAGPGYDGPTGLGAPTGTGGL
jgi:subtilase family serine protease